MAKTVIIDEINDFPNKSELAALWIKAANDKKVALAKEYPFSIPRTINSWQDWSYNEIKIWFKEQHMIIEQDVIWAYGEFWFKDPEKAMIFKLFWG